MSNDSNAPINEPSLEEVEAQLRYLKAKRDELLAAKREPLSLIKALKIFDLLDPVLWMKSVAFLFRSVIIVGIVLGLIFGVGYWKGRKNAPVQVNSPNFVAYVKDNEGKEHKIESRNGRLYFDDQIIRAKDIPAIKPYGVDLRPKLFIGGPAGKLPIGIGAKVFHFYNFNFDVFYIPNVIGAGISYQLHLDKVIKVENTSVGIGLGQDLDKKEQAVVFYVGWEF
jgi:hypothetical protein